MLTPDILIIGSGIAGLSLALKLSPFYKVLMVTKREAMEANTRYAQGGIASVTSGTDDFDSHIQDTLIAGAGLCDIQAVKHIVEKGPALIQELVSWGVSFSKSSPQEFDLGREGGHSQRRILHAGDMTGSELEKVLLKKVKASSVMILENHAAVNLITKKKLEISDENSCLGAYVLDVKTGEVKTIRAGITVLASGGAGKVYLYTSNPDIATGDGVAMAYRAGAAIANLEFVQFHPTCLYNPGAFVSVGERSSPKTFLISEALRGEGAILKLPDGTPFMESYHPLKDLAPRDTVARAIDQEMKKGGLDYIFLDISHRPKKFIEERFPNIARICAQAGFDLSTGPIPVVPAAHYFCGGVKTDLKGESSVKSLFAIGEVASTGLHGANRLASNSLLEAISMADDLAQFLIKSSGAVSQKTLSLPLWNPGEAVPIDEKVVIQQNWDEIRRLMWNYVGIVRTNKRLLRAKKRIDLLREEIREYYWNFHVSQDLIELRNLALVADLIVTCALQRKESRGLHFNLDYPETIEMEKKDTIVAKSIY